MRKETVRLTDDTDKTGGVITIFKTEIVTNDKGLPVIVNSSPLVEDFKMTIVQFSVTKTVYDPETRKQFAAKKASYLLTEQAKADREKETQNRLMIVEKGLREKAEAEATGNVAKITAVIAAELKAEVALQTKIAAETQASQLLSVAEISKRERLMIASAGLEVAVIKAKEAEQEKIATILKAEGLKEAIELSGAISEIEEALIAAGVNKAIGVANAYAKIKVPEVVIIGGGGDGGGADITQTLFNYRLMQGAGLLDATKVNKVDVQRKVR